MAKDSEQELLVSKYEDVIRKLESDHDEAVRALKL